MMIAIFIECDESRAGKLYGKSSIDQIADDFALHGLKKRAATLEDLDTELRGEIDSGSYSLRRRVQLMTLRKKWAAFMSRCARPNADKGHDEPSIGAGATRS
jgi:hypothetical protein